MKLVPFLVYCTVVAGCAIAPTTTGTNQTAADIQKSCDDKDQQQTIINGHAYFCMDFNHFQQQMDAIAKALQSRGI